MQYEHVRHVLAQDELRYQAWWGLITSPVKFLIFNNKRSNPSLYIKRTECPMICQRGGGCERPAALHESTSPYILKNGYITFYLSIKKYIIIS